MSVNKATLIGNVGKDIEFKTLENGTAIAKTSLATNESYKDKNSGEWIKKTEWHNLVFWRKSAELANQLLTKGKLIFVEGKITTRKWKDNNEVDRYTTEIVVNEFKLLGKKEDSNGSNNFPSAAEPKASNPVSKEEPKTIEDDLPF